MWSPLKANLTNMVFLVVSYIGLSLQPFLTTYIDEFRRVINNPIDWTVSNAVTGYASVQQSPSLYIPEYAIPERRYAP